MEALGAHQRSPLPKLGQIKERMREAGQPCRAACLAPS